MKLLLSILFSCSALAADAMLAAVLLTRPMGLRGVLALLVVHAVVASIAAAAVQIGAPQAAAASRGWYFALGFVIAFFVPVASPIGLQLMVRLGLAARDKAGAEPWVSLELDEALASRGTAITKRGMPAAKILSILGRRGAQYAEQRFNVLLQVKHLPPDQQVRILKFALKDSSDEVRLFAFARIERFRADLEAKIKQFTAELEGADGDDLARLHLRLAESYHEIAYLQLAEGAVLDHALGEALTHGLEARRLRSGSGPAEYVLGRILLRKRQPEEAFIAFENALKFHYPRERVLPYLAECAFRQRRYGVVRTMLADLSRSTSRSTALEPLIDFWR